jgi:Cu/Ag efflux pump CusA
VIFGGLLTSTLLNLFVMPALYLRWGRRRKV